MRVSMLKGSPAALRADARGKGRLLPVHTSRLAALTSVHLADGCAASCWPAMCAYAKAENEQLYAQLGDWRPGGGGRGGPQLAAAIPYYPPPDVLAGLAALTGMPPALTLCVCQDSHEHGRAECTDAARWLCRVARTWWVLDLWWQRCLPSAL